MDNIMHKRANLNCIGCPSVENHLLFQHHIFFDIPINILSLHSRKVLF